MNYSAIIFDLDGTLIDSMLLWRRVDREFLNKRGIEVPSDLFDHLPQGNSFIQTAQYFRDRFGLSDSVESIMQEWTDMVSHHYANTVSLKDGVCEIISLLQCKSIPLGLGTSNSYELAQKVLSQHDIWNCFSAVVTGDLHMMGKPWPDIYIKAAEELKTNPADCLVIEDTLTGVMAGKAAGMTVYAIYDPDSDPQRDDIIELADLHFQTYQEMLEQLHQQLNETL